MNVKTLRMVVPLLLINMAALYGQVSFAYETIAPPEWTTAAKVVLACGVAAAIESVALYVSWHAMDALLLKSYGTAARLRRTAYLIAFAVGLMNYSHFTSSLFAPTAAAITFGLLSLVSPWLWGLHARRERHVQLMSEDRKLIDDAGVEFSPERWKAFPLRAFMARRYALDEYITEPREAWTMYKSHRNVKRAMRTQHADTKDDSVSAYDWSILESADDAPISPVPTPTVPADETPTTMAGRIRAVAESIGSSDVDVIRLALLTNGVKVTPSRIRDALSRR
jgi:hypothetical protein